MKTAEIRKKFLDFFKSKDHKIIPSAPIVPEHDPTVLFTTAGMHPLIPYLLGEQHPEGKRLANVQKCIRTTDIDEVGDNVHLTMFEMLGNWSFGDYFKDESIKWSWEFLTNKKWLGIDPKKLYVSVYQGDPQVPKDNESIKFWKREYKKSGIEAKEGERILALGKDENWWEQGGVESGPAGPDTEIYYYLSDEKTPKFDVNNPEFVEIWNNVFMSYRKQSDGSYIELKDKNVDTGMGLERTAAVLQGVKSVFDTDLLKQIAIKIEEFAKNSHHQVFEETSPQSLGRAVRIITDHLRTVTFMAADGVEPSNIERGYVMRRLARRAIREALVLGVNHNLFANIMPKVIELYNEAYPELKDNKQAILTALDKEEMNFRKTLVKGLREFEKISRDNKTLTGEIVFKLYDTYGFPKELSIEEAKRLDMGIAPDLDDKFELMMNEQKQRSRTATKGIFKGGLADDSKIVTRYHTATHIMYKALRNILGDHVMQRGSNITAERMRFDFSHHEKLTSEQIRKVEEAVNDAIKQDLPVSFEQMSKDQAFGIGALGAFGEKYGDVVKVYTIGDPKDDYFSREICGGPHVKKTGEIGKFKIIKEESSSAGVRRIKAVIK
ncbi:MAG: alanine--tRNA ligase [bacterium]|nr:alanine--tRNA ligase [bacterium]